MEIEITDHPGRSYCSIRIPSLSFIGMLDRSTDKRFGIASGVVTTSHQRLVLYLCDGAIAWSIDNCAPIGIRFLDDGWGYFENHNIYVFNTNGIIFSAERPMGFDVRDAVFYNDRVVFLCERLIFTYDWLGNLIEQKIDAARIEERLFAGELPDMLRWDRYRKAEELLALATQGNASASTDANKLLDICSRQFGDNPTMRAKCYRFMGELALLDNDTELAIKHWRTALQVDSKSGVKRKLLALEKSREDLRQSCADNGYTDFSKAKP